MYTQHQEGQIVKIIVESNLTVRNILEPPLTLRYEGEIVTIKDVLKTLAKKCSSVEFLNKEGKLGEDLKEIFVNGKSFFTLTGGLNVCLKEGDNVRIEVAINPIGGG